MTLSKIVALTSTLPIGARQHFQNAAELHLEVCDIFRRARIGLAQDWEISRASLLRRCIRDEKREAYKLMPQRRRAKRRAAQLAAAA